MSIQINTPLHAFNTFGINAKAERFIEIRTVDELKNLIQSSDFDSSNYLILGGGSNILLTRDFPGLVIRNLLKGIEVTENREEINLAVGAGENWHEFVMHCIDKQYAGLENLSLIPGSVGASPMQNIGAYGVEVKDYISQVEAIDIKSGDLIRFDNEACKFGYRSSIFKTTHKDQYFITKVHFKLSRQAEFKVSYGAIQDQLKSMGVLDNDLSIRAISDAVIAIRKSKLQDPAEIGNSGSFFKNPVVSAEKYEQLKQAHPEIPAYPAGEKNFKLAAGWLIEQAGWKGYTEAQFGVHKKQALVLVNYGGASGKEIYDLSERIVQDIQQKFAILLEREVNII